MGRKKSTMKVRKGKRGGRYVNKNGRRNYLKRNQKRGEYKRRSEPSSF